MRAFSRVDYMPKLIEAEIAGKNMTALELYDDEKVIKDCMWLFEKFLGRSIPKPTDMKRTKWLTNPNFYGTYSYQSLSADIHNIYPEQLARPIVGSDNRPLILFAGEATDGLFASNVHGALSSGWRAADELISHFSRATKL